MASEQRASVVDSVQRLFETGTLSAQSEAQLLERFLAEKDEAAFQAILLRHGKMVLAVCQRILNDPHDVDDAFQATFLVLVEKAKSIRDRDVLGVWLYGVARRVAVRARVNAKRRRVRERTNGEETVVEKPRSSHDEAHELRSVIDDEVAALPYRYRAPLVLCELEGRTLEQAAAQLCCPVGTIKSRLSRGRERLRFRLIRRGLAPSSALLASCLNPEPTSAGSVALMDLTLKAATRYAAGHVTAGMISAEALALAKGVILSMNVFPFKVAAAALLAIGLTAAGVGTLVHSTTLKPQEKSSGKQPEQLLALAGETKMSVPGGESWELPNGLKVILRPIRGAQQTALIVLYSIGGDHDPDGQSGLAHMVEHVYVTAGAGPEKARNIQEFLRRYPQGSNAQTGDQYTVFSTVFTPDKLKNEIMDAAARMGDLRLTDGDMASERPRILQEVDNMFQGFPALAASNNAQELVRPTPGGGRRGGQPQSIKNLTIEQVKTHWARYYKPKNAILALAGAVDSKAARTMIETYFAPLPSGEKASAPRQPGQPKYGESRELKVASPAFNAKAMASLGYRAPLPGDNLYAPFLVLITRLWVNGAKLNDEGPTGAPVFFTPLDNPNAVTVSTALRNGETGVQALARLEAFVAETVKPKLAPNESDNALQQLGFLLGTADLPDEVLAQNPYGVAFSVARRMQLGFDSYKLAQALKAVTDQDLRRAAQEIFAPGRHAGAVISLGK